MVKRNEIDMTPTLVEYVDGEKLNDYQKRFIRVGDQAVIARHYAVIQAEAGIAQIVREMPAGTPYGAYKER